MGKIIICRADEVLGILAKNDNVASVLSIEHPGAEKDKKGRAPRLAEEGFEKVAQKVLTFWDAEEKVHQGPDVKQVSKGIDFIMQHIAKGDVIIHCHAGKARSTAMALGAMAILHPDKCENTLAEELLAIRAVAAPNIIVVGFVDKIAGRQGALVKVVKDHPVLKAQRLQVEQNRQKWLARDKESYKRMHPEKFPDKTQGKHKPNV